MRQQLATGDHLEVHICETECSEKIPPANLPLDIVYEDEDIIVINKPAGMPIHPSMKNYTNSMANALAYYYQEQHKPFIFRCSNRLDRDTSGLTVVAKHLVSASILASMVARKEVEREYLAIVSGHVTPEEGTIDAPLARKEGTIIERMVDFEHGEKAITHYKVVQKFTRCQPLRTSQLTCGIPHQTDQFACEVPQQVDQFTCGLPHQGMYHLYSLVSLRLETGRTHQIRIHMKYLGYPLIGDYLYHPDMELIGRQALHSYKLSFRHPITGEFMEFTAPLPDDMRSVLAEDQ
ncbi:MAG: RluA family pseudouridine synthase [Roseburia sp.]|nr:RluA family pseudouridine synthase [Roseburia sp.]